ncbi:NBR1-Ig-like domain-containing protein [Thauera aromatica]|nr:NBR1-Ig-like domain-containing protein [Thauera aromatica]MCK2126663.1 NBR1-Ig-like domain-containing protein [Thauera aromatica]
MRKYFEQYVRARCRTLRISISELALRAGTSREHLYRLMRGEVFNPSLQTMHGLASGLNVSTLYLLRHYFEELNLGGGIELPGRHEGDQESFVHDVTIPDGTLLGPNQAFTKTWAIQNTGDLAWAGRRLVCVDEDYVLAKRQPCGKLLPVLDNQLLPGCRETAVPDCLPGEVVEISLQFTTPALPCTTLSLWKMVDAEGQPCFPGNIGLWVKVRVVAL